MRERAEKKKAAVNARLRSGYIIDVDVNDVDVNDGRSAWKESKGKKIFTQVKLPGYRIKKRQTPLEQ